MVESISSAPSKIPGRGGASLTVIDSSEKTYTLLLVYGANRERQLDDFWTISIDRETCSAKSASRVKVTELDGFTTRNSMSSVATGDRVVFFGGQDSEQGKLFNEVFQFFPKTGEVRSYIYAEGAVVPVERNSHTMTKVESSEEEVAYLFGGANESGALKDLYRVDLKNMEFAPVKVNEGKVILPYLEMHTAHIYQKTKLLIIGGRGYFPGSKPEEATFTNNIYAIDLTSGAVELFGTLPSDLASHCSALINDDYLVVYGGTNGLRFFDSILRYQISTKQWRLMTKYPKHCKGSKFFSHGRISASCVKCGEADLIVFFGGTSIEQDWNDFLVLPVAEVLKDANFSEITEIM